MSCGCIPIIDAKLAERNTRVMLPIMLGADQTARPMIVTDQIETGRGKKKAVGLFATFCPFCGVSYSAEAAMPAPSDQEPVVVIGKDWSLLWASPDSLTAIVDRTGIKIGSKLYAHPAPSDQEKLQWQPIETAPFNELVWCFEPHDIGGFMFAGGKNNGGNWYNNLDDKRQYPTHWMPLPAAPQIGGAS